MYSHTMLALGEIDAIVVPHQAVLKLQGSNDRYIFVNDNGVAKRVSVALGQRFDDKTEIISNEIKAGLQLITTGQARLIDGSIINVVAD